MGGDAAAGEPSAGAPASGAWGASPPPRDFMLRTRAAWSTSLALASVYRYVPAAAGLWRNPNTNPAS
jgi:hypothetical protein